jgi:hypothetical protein
LFSGVWIWRGSEADLCLQFRDGGVEAASIVKTGRGGNIYANLFWSLGFIFAADAMLAWYTLFVSCYGLILLLLFGCHCYLLLFVCFLLWFDVATGVTLFATY